MEEAQEGLKHFPDFKELALYAGNLAFRLEKFIDAEHYYNMAAYLGSPGAISGLENVRIAREQKNASLLSDAGLKTGRSLLIQP